MATPQPQKESKLQRCHCGAPLITRGLDPYSAVDVCVICQMRDRGQIDALVPRRTPIGGLARG